MLGYNVAIPEAKSTYGLAEVGEEFWRSDLQCQGDEESLEDCDGKENPGCTRGEVAGVTCFLGGETITIVLCYYLLQRIKKPYLQQQVHLQLQP